MDPSPACFRARVSLSSCFVLLGLTGCSDPTTKDVKIECTNIPGEMCPEDGDETGGSEDSGDETGGSEEPTPLGPGECRHNDLSDMPATGYRYQCEGELHTRLSFEVLNQDCTDILDPSWCNQHHPFSASLQPYAAAEVMACCGEYDPAQAEEYELFCAYDLYQQLCISLGERLEAAINAGEFEPFTNQATNLQSWVVDHYEDCFNTLRANNSAPLPSIESSWTIGDFGLLKDIVVHIDAPTEIFGVNLPSDPGEWLECTSANDNNDEVFENGGNSGGVTPILHLAAPLDAELTGPSSFATKVSAAASFETSCSPRGCPNAALLVEGETLTLTKLELFEDDPMQINAGDFGLDVDRVRVSLWAPAKGYEQIDPGTGDRSYMLPARSAQFMIAGFSPELGANRLMAQNTSAIELRPSEAGWSLGEVELAFIDGSGAAWMVTLSASEWRESPS